MKGFLKKALILMFVIIFACIRYGDRFSCLLLLMQYAQVCLDFACVQQACLKPGRLQLACKASFPACVYNNMQLDEMIAYPFLFYTFRKKYSKSSAPE